MLSETSPIFHFYPQEFETDLNGKKQDWEAVVLIPFINEQRLIEAMTSVEHKLEPVERARNVHGPCLIYRYVSCLLVRDCCIYVNHLTVGDDLSYSGDNLSLHAM